VTGEDHDKATRSNLTVTKLRADYQLDEETIQALVTGAFVALGSRETRRAR
jgi:hypothetical protein